MDDRTLLQAYTNHHSEEAFAELVARHAGLVYSTALRLVGDSHQAKDLAQTVFIGLAQKPWSVRSPEALGGWLHRATRFTAAKMIRTEQRRRQRETEAMHRQELDPSPPAVWEAIQPLLEEALAQLGRLDQDAVVLRFFEGKSLRETGEMLALTDKAVSKRVDRALERLRSHFARRGVTVSSALLASAIGANSVHAAPPGLSASLAGTALAGADGASFTGTLFKLLFMTTKIKILLTLAAILAVASVYLFFWSEAERVRGPTAVSVAAIKNPPVVVSSSSASASAPVNDTTVRSIPPPSAMANPPAADPLIPKSSARVWSQGQYLAVDQFGDAGLATPEDALQTLFYAMKTGDTKRKAEATLPPALAANVTSEVDPKTELRKIQSGEITLAPAVLGAPMDYKKILGGTVVRVHQNSPDQVQINVNEVWPDDKGDGEEIQSVWVLQRYGQEWRYAPYGAAMVKR